MTSYFSTKIQAALDFKQAMGKDIKTHAIYLKNFDCFCTMHYPDASILSKEIAWDWVYSPSHKKRNSGVNNRIYSIRFLGEYLVAIGDDAYIFPDLMTSNKQTFSQYIFTDDELRRFFTATDNLPTSSQNPFQQKIAPVVFRLIYTCGLRPNEGRELKSENINFDNGEILITNTKHQKERLVVMSDDMLELCRLYNHYLRLEMTGKSEFFFPMQNGDCYTTAQIRNLFKKCWRLANPGVSELPSVRIYDLRHRFASTVLNRWIDEKRDLYAMLPYLRAYMGHLDLSATEYYIHLLPENLIKSPGINWSGLESLIPEV